MPSPLEQVFNLEAVLEADGTIRLPEVVISALRLAPGERVIFRVGADRKVTIEKVGTVSDSSRCAGSLDAPALLAVAKHVLGDQPLSANPQLFAALEKMAGGLPLLDPKAQRGSDGTPAPPADRNE